MTTQLDQIEQAVYEILDILKTSPPPIPELPPVNGSLFGRTKTRWVQIIVSRNLKVPIVRNGKLLYNKKGGLRHKLPPLGQRKKYNVGDRIEVFMPHIQGDGQRVWEDVKRPGNLLMDRDVFKV